jgi:hypothetical protein
VTSAEIYYGNGVVFFLNTFFFLSVFWFFVAYRDPPEKILLLTEATSPVI